jgi:hypothetical protein
MMTNARTDKRGVDSRRLCRHGRQHPIGAAMNKGLTLKMGQTYVQA